MAHLGDRVRALRKRDRLTQGALALKLHLVPQAVSVIESSGKTSDETLEKLLSVFEVNKQWLTSGTGAMPIGVELPDDANSTQWKDEAYRTLERENQRLNDMVEFMKTLIPRQSFLLPTRNEAQLSFSFGGLANEVGEAA